VGAVAPVPGKAVLDGLALIGLLPHADDSGEIVAVCPVCEDDGASLRASATAPISLRCLLGCSTAHVIEAVRGKAAGLPHNGMKVALEVLCCEADRNKLLRLDGAAGPEARPRPTRIPLSLVVSKAVEWLWDRRIPLGAVSSVDGMPGAGKSTLLAEVVACVTTGRALPSEDQARAPRAALWIGHEEGAGTAIKPRLEAAGADVGKVFVYDRMPSFPADYEWLREEIRQTGAVVVVVDPIDAYMDFGARGDSHRNGDVRARLAALATVADETGAAIIMVRHWRKSGGVQAIYRAAGSLAYSALARAVASVVCDPQDPGVRLALWSKVSGGADVETLRFGIEPAGTAARVRWLGSDDRTADDIMQATDARANGRGEEGKASTATDAAEEWLMAYLDDHGGAASVGPLLAAGEEAGHTSRTLRRARERLKLAVRRISVGGEGEGEWRWLVPPTRGR
jgi:hypothetical protein